MDDWAYYAVKGVVMGGVWYSGYETATDKLVAVDGKNGVMFKLSATGKWIVGVYGESVTRFRADWVIQSVAKDLD